MDAIPATIQRCASSDRGNRISGERGHATGAGSGISSHVMPNTPSQ
jgi:hypothetical protein